MPFLPSQRRFFGLCYAHPEKAYKKCPSKEDALRMLKEGVKEDDKKKKKK